MKIFYDLEFLDDGRVIEPVSIGMVAENQHGKIERELYAINAGMPWKRIVAHPWLRHHVVPHLPLVPYMVPPMLDYGHPDVLPRQEIVRMVVEFIRATPNPELWGFYSAYDYVALCQLLGGPMSRLPAGVPSWTNDLKQLAAYLRVDDDELPSHKGTMHCAIDDARWCREVFYFLDDRLPG